MIQRGMVRVCCPSCGSSSARYERQVNGFRLERCIGCAFVFVNPQYSTEMLSTVYGNRDARRLLALYDRIHSSSTTHDYDRILREVELAAGKRGRLLDFGCGTGHFVEHANRNGSDAHGIDVGSWVGEAAALRNVPNIHVGELKEGDFAAESFDVICASQVLEHLPTPRTELEEIRRILKAGGIFYANVPNYQCVSIVLGRDDFELNIPPQHLNYFTPRTLGQMCRCSGFQVLRTRTYAGLKWENLFGRPTVSHVSDAYKSDSKITVEETAERRVHRALERTGLKRAMFPFVDLLFYRFAQVGLVLEIVARKQTTMIA